MYPCGQKKKILMRKKKKTHGQNERQIEFTYVAGDEVTEFAMIPLNLRQVHCFVSVFEFSK